MSCLKRGYKSSKRETVSWFRNIHIQLIALGGAKYFYFYHNDIQTSILREAFSEQFINEKIPKNSFHRQLFSLVLFVKYHLADTFFC